eukprot:618608-Prorocentrum_minimum.AAC.1
MERMVTALALTPAAADTSFVNVLRKEASNAGKPHNPCHRAVGGEGGGGGGGRAGGRGGSRGGGGRGGSRGGGGRRGGGRAGGRAGLGGGCQQKQHQ